MINKRSETTPTGQEDSLLIQQCRQEPAAFTALYRKYLGPVYRYHYARTGHAADAEDLTSQTFLAALEALPRYRDQGTFAAWLFAIARCKVADHYREATMESLEDWSEQISAEDPRSDPAGDILQAEERRRLARRLAGLDEDERELLRFAACLPFEQIAALLGRKLSAVKMALYRLLERLERQMEADHA